MRSAVFFAVLITSGASSIIVEAQEAQRVEDIVVTGVTATATKTPTAIIDIPSSVSLIDGRRLEDRKPQTLSQIVGYVPGVNVGNYGFDSRYDAFFIRGFQATYTGVFRDGLRQLNSPSGLYRNEPYGLESLSVLRGPASVLYGASGAGGLVDGVTKRPTGDIFGEVEGLIGSYDRYQINGDFGGASGDLAWRLTGVARESDSHLPGFPDDRLMIAPALTWTPSDATRITVLGEYMNSLTGGSAAFYNDASVIPAPDSLAGPGTVSADRVITDIVLADERISDFDHEQWRLSYEIEHSFGNGLTLVQNARFQEVDAYLEYAYFLDPENDLVTKGSGVANDVVDAFTIDNQARYTLNAGGVRHRLLAGLDYSDVDYISRDGFGSIPQTGNVVTPDLIDTVAQSFSQTGLYIQDQIEAGRLGVVVGLRHDWLEASTNRFGISTFDQNDSATTGRIGVTYDLDGGVTPYANWSSSFEPNIGLLLDGTPARPTEARQVEVGVKYQPRTGVLLTAALFDIEQQDGVVFDAADGINRQVQQDLTSRGLELEASVRLAEGLDLTAAYAYTDAEIERGGSGATGNTPSGTPAHMASVFADYTVPGTGFGFGAGLRYFGESFGNDLNTIDNDDRLFADAVIHYDLPQVAGVRLQVNATNLFDTEPINCTAGYCYREQGRTVMASARYRF